MAPRLCGGVIDGEAVIRPVAFSYAGCDCVPLYCQMMRWWQIPIGLAVGAVGTYLWAVPSSTFQQHMSKLWHKINPR